MKLILLKIKTVAALFLPLALVLTIYGCTREVETKVTSVETVELETRDTAFASIQDLLTADCAEKLETCESASEVTGLDLSKLQESLVIADFDIEKKVDKKRYESWTTRPSDDSQGTRIKMFNDDYKLAYRQDRFSMRIMYDVETEQPVTNGSWIRLPGINATRFDYFSFWARSDDRIVSTTTFNVGLLNEDGELYLFRVENLDSEWKQFVFKLKHTKGVGNLTGVKKIYLIFNSQVVTKAKGIIYFDHFEFLKFKS